MLDVKNIGKPCAGKSHARFDEGGQLRGCSLLYLASQYFREKRDDTRYAPNFLEQAFSDFSCVSYFLLCQPKRAAILNECLFIFIHIFRSRTE